MPASVEFCFAHEDLFLVPAEELSPEGIRAPFAARLCERGVISEPWLRRFDNSRTYRTRHPSRRRNG